MIILTESKNKAKSIKMDKTMLNGLSVYMKMNQKAYQWNNSNRIDRHPKKSIFLNKPFVIKDLKWGDIHAGMHIRFQIQYVPVWIKEQSYRVNSVRTLPVIENYHSKKANKLYGQWLKKHSEPNIDKMITNTAVVLEEVIYRDHDHKTTVKTFSTYNDLANALILELKQHKFLQKQIF